MYAKRFDAASGKWDDEPTLLSERRVNEEGLFTGNPRVRFDSHGNAVALWAETVSGRLHVIHARCYDAQSGTWAPSEQLSDGSGSAFSADLATGPAGDAVAVWVQSVAGRGDIVRSKRFDARAQRWDAVATDL